MAMIAFQDFNGLTGLETLTTDSLADGSQLTNPSSFIAGGPGLDFATVWNDTRSEGLGPVVNSDAGDLIGVSFNSGTDAPDVAADGTPIAEGIEQTFQFNDTDGQTLLVFEPVDLRGFTNRTFSLNYWIGNTGYEGDDSFSVILSDSDTTLSVLNFGEVELEANVSADDGTANWKTISVDIEPLFGQGLDEMPILSIGVDNNAGAENIFVDNIRFEGDAVAVNLPPEEPPSNGGTSEKTDKKADERTGTAPPAINFKKGKKGERFRGANDNDRIKGTKGNDRIFGRGGKDKLSGRSGNDRIKGGGGNDTIRAGKGDDLLEGGEGRDRILGQRGDNLIVGGLGNDLLVGGSGIDTFVYKGLDDGKDNIQRFDPDKDLIDMSNIVKQPEFSRDSGIQQFTEFVQLVEIGGNTDVRIDADGRGIGTDMITLAVVKGVTGLSSENVVVD